MAENHDPMAAAAQAGPPQQPGFAPSPASGAAPGQARRVGKVRHPWGAWALSLITFGVYQLYWWYKVNQEARDYDPTVQVEPGLSVLALFVPIATLVSLVRTGSRIGQAQQSGGVASRCSGALGFLLAILFATHIVYYQSSLNRIWAEHGDQPPGTLV